MSAGIIYTFDLFPLLPPGAIIRLGRGTVLRFNHPNEAAHLKENCQVQKDSKTITNKPCCVLVLFCCFCKAEGASLRKRCCLKCIFFPADNFVKASQHHALCIHYYQL